jgi:Zn-dependent peptidase ImmA (M78 family)
MVEVVSGLNPNVLKWARDRSGYSIEDIADRFNGDLKIIESWEDGSKSPTYVQLEKLAYQIYKRPIAIFFFPEPPDEPDPTHSFRTLPEFEIKNLNAGTRFEIRQAISFQNSLKELNNGINPFENPIFKEFQISENDNIFDISKRIRTILTTPLKDQIKWKDSREALDKWRDVILEVGIFILKDSFEQNDISGFCLFDDEFPIVYLNNSTSANRQIFTIFHELAHILLKNNGITKFDFSYINHLQGRAKKIEMFCNAFAGEFLVPTREFISFAKKDFSKDSDIISIANYFKVSKDVILRKAFDQGLIDQGYYLQKYQVWQQEWLRKNKERKSKKGGNYYLTQSSYLGKGFLNIAFSKYYKGQCSIEQLADYLNVKVKSISGLENAFLGKKSYL